MKNYSEMTNSVLKRAAEIREEQHEKARKTRKSLTALGCAAVMLALAVGAVLLIKPFGARGDGPYAQDAKNTADAIKSSPEPTPRGSNSPSFITETTRVKSYEEGDKLNTELAVSMLTEEGYIHFEYGMMRRKCYSGDDPVLRNCTPNYVRKHSSDIELFVLAPDTSVDYNRYFIRLGDTLYRYEPNNLGYDYNYMCLWDHDNNGVDDIVLLSTAFPGSCFMTDIFDVSTKTVKQILTRDMIRFPVFSFQFDGTSIYLDQNKVDYIDGEFYLGGVKADESVLGSAAVKRYEDGDGLNTNRALELLRSDGYIDIRTGEVHFDYYNISYVALRNCTPSYIRERSEDIELFQDSTGMCFVRLGDKLYNSYGAWHICMCLWDHDGNGVDDLVFISNWGSGNTHLAASVFDLSTKSHRKILSLSAHSDPPFRFDFDGESIYIDGLKVECANGKFFIGGMDADEYALMKLYSAESHENTPEPTPSGEPEPIFITDKTALYYDDDTASLNVELVLSMLKTDGYIDGYDGVKRKDSEPSIEICNCTPEYFRKNFPDIELFVDMKQDDRSEYIIRYGDKLYRFDFEKGRHHNMCLWDYDGNGVDDLVFYSSTWSSEAIAYQRIDCIDVCKDQLKLILHRRADFPSCIISFDYDGKNVYVDKLKLDFWAEAAYIDGRMADSYLPEFETEHELIPFKSIFVKEYADGSTFNTARACSIIEDSGFILEDGSRITDFNTASLQLYNCTSYDVAWKTSDIELFYNNPHDWPAYFLRIGDELYRCDAFGGHHIFMCLWDYDKNGVDDVVLVSECGSGTTIHKAVVFDVCNKSWKTIISRNIMCEDGFTFHFDGENIYIHFKKAKYKNGEFLIDGMIANDYVPDMTSNEPNTTPEPTPSGSSSPSFINEDIMVKSYDEGDMEKTELVYSMLESQGYISVFDGLVYTDYSTTASRLRNCTPAFIREKRDDIDLFQNDDYAYFLRLGNRIKPYRFDAFGGGHIKMCLWDYDDNGVDDLVFYYTWGSGVSHLEADVFDLSTGTRLVVLCKIAELGQDDQGFTLQYDGERIYIDRQTVEYTGGEFHIGSINANEYKNILTADPAQNTP